MARLTAYGLPEHLATRGFTTQESGPVAPPRLETKGLSPFFDNRTDLMVHQARPPTPVSRPPHKAATLLDM